MKIIQRGKPVEFTTLDVVYTPISIKEASRALNITEEQLEIAAQDGILQKSCAFQERFCPETNLPNVCDVVRFYVIMSASRSAQAQRCVIHQLDQLLDAQIETLDQHYTGYEVNINKELCSKSQLLQSEIFWLQYFHETGFDRKWIFLVALVCQAWSICLESLSLVMNARLAVLSRMTTFPLSDPPCSWQDRF